MGTTNFRGEMPTMGDVRGLMLLDATPEASAASALWNCSFPSSPQEASRKFFLVASGGLSCCDPRGLTFLPGLLPGVKQHRMWVGDGQQILSCE